MRPSLELPSLCLVADTSVVGRDEIVPRVSAAVAGGVSLVQLRAKELPGGRMMSLAEELQVTIGGRALLLVNERIDIAVAAAADGVQLGEEALPVTTARRLLPGNALIGRSVHSVDGAADAFTGGADFLVVGTMFATGSHPGAVPAGPGLMREVSRLLSLSKGSLPLIGIGGITAGNLAEVVNAGASGVAVIRSILSSPDPQAAASDLKLALQEAWQSRPPLSEPVPAHLPCPEACCRYD